MTHSLSVKKVAFSAMKQTLKCGLLLIGTVVIGLPANLFATPDAGPDVDCSRCHDDGRTWASVHGGGGVGDYTGIPKPPLAQVAGTIYPGNSAVPGGKLYYKYALQTLKAGKAVIKYKLVVSQTAGAKWTPKTPADLTVNVPKGTTRMSSFVGDIPSDFRGTVKLSLSFVFTAGSNSLNVSVKPVTVAIAPQTDFYDVGFGNTVTLDASGISTAGMGTNVTYTWTQRTNSLGNITPGGVLSAMTGKVTVLTTGGVTNFVDTTPSGRAPTSNIVGLDNELSKDATYIYEVKVSGKKITRTGTFTVSCAVQSPGTSRIPIGVNACYMGPNTTNTNWSYSTNWSLLSKPTNSTASLTHTNEILPQLRPDVAGVYIISNNITGQCITNTAASYAGWWSCYGCHGPYNSLTNKDMVTPWSSTAHATMAQWGIDGGTSGYNETCFQCHALGYNQSVAAASNGNFKAVANELGWKFPAKVKVGNFDGMPKQLQQLAAIQCESCHGPGTHELGKASASLGVQVCASCHQDGTYYNTVAQWKNGPHGGSYNTLSLAEGTQASCARCHAPNGFLEVAKRIDDRIASGMDPAVAQTNSITNVPTGTGSLTCQTCHDPHDNFGDDTRHQLRIADTVVVGDLTVANYATLTNVGTSAACMICHNSRGLPLQVSSGTAYYKKTRSGSISGPHLSPVAEVFSGYGSPYTNYAMINSAHASVATCQTCHMYQLRDVDSRRKPQDYLSINETYTPVSHAVYTDLRDLVGNHTFSVANDYVTRAGTSSVTNHVENIAACNGCHRGSVTTFDTVVGGARDYDGNGKAEGIQTETAGLLGRVATLITNTGVVPNLATNGGVVTISGFKTNGLSTNAIIQDAQYKAAWNWKLINNDGSLGVHNTAFAVRLLQTTWSDLNTTWTGNTNNTFKAVYTNAYIR